jgi:hypothetical protein
LGRLREFLQANWNEANPAEEFTNRVPVVIQIPLSLLLTILPEAEREVLQAIEAGAFVSTRKSRTHLSRLHRRIRFYCGRSEWGRIRRLLKYSPHRDSHGAKLDLVPLVLWIPTEQAEGYTILQHPFSSTGHKKQAQKRKRQLGDIRRLH